MRIRGVFVDEDAQRIADALVTASRADGQGVTSTAASSSISELKPRIDAEFDQMEALPASGTLEERRALVGRCATQTKKKPGQETVLNGVRPGLDQLVAGTGGDLSRVIRWAYLRWSA